MANWLAVTLVVSCLLVGSVTPQITFSRSWVPQGKRSSDPAEPADPCRDAKMATLTTLAGQLVDLINEVGEADHTALPEDATAALRLRHTLLQRRRRMA
ncbi:uncharacterized protein LOC126993888 isoform X3 [Eriocheir sinensis]|uniref:uncharacterized protein LOC126993888 isoform X1 n=1 Tax=Eriocheir sinensis TaxID=95602 RepID=UPI0021C905D0|nr:uncharacterized protein LOC126993888 isoform X1 [Eriocheir sinensis]XP_050708981.1 uncharacterized protein LOC126993888 isoform X3 [Eriocheir sinensis]